MHELSEVAQLVGDGQGTIWVLWFQILLFLNLSLFSLLSKHLSHLATWLKCRVLQPTLPWCFWRSRSGVGLGWRLKVCLSYEFPADVEATGPIWRTTVGFLLSFTMFSECLVAVSCKIWGRILHIMRIPHWSQKKAPVWLALAGSRERRARISLRITRRYLWFLPFYVFFIFISTQYTFRR